MLGARARRTWDAIAAHLQRELTADPRALALMRVALGTLVAFDALSRLGDAGVFYGDEGFMPRSETALPLFWGHRLYWLSGDPTFSQALLVAGALAGLSFCLGIATRIANLLAWIFLGALHARNELVLQGGDVLLHNMLLWSLLLPMGARWSLDARRRGAPAVSRFTGPAVWTLYLQMFLVYFVTGTLKANHVHWWLGEGVYHALHADHFVTPLGRWLRPHTAIVSLLTWATLALEIVGPFLLIASRAESRLRKVLIVLYLAFHAGIAATLALGLFSLVCMASWLFALPSSWLDRLQAPAGAAAPAAPRWVSAVAIALSIYLVFATAVRDRLPDKPLRSALLLPARTLRLHLMWRLFIGPREDTGWFVVHARHADGRETDLLRGGAPLSFARPDDVQATFPNQRWRKMLVAFRKPHGRRALGRYLRWLCSREDLVEVRFVYVRHALGVAETTPEVIASRRCGR